jgi:hypothetical protein
LKECHAPHRIDGKKVGRDKNTNQKNLKYKEHNNSGEQNGCGSEREFKFYD